MKNLKSLFLTALCALLFSAMAWADAQVVVTGTNVRLRVAPSLNSQTLTTSNGVNIHPKKGEKLTCTGKTGDFYVYFQAVCQTRGIGQQDHCRTCHQQAAALCGSDWNQCAPAQITLH